MLPLSGVVQRCTVDGERFDARGPRRRVRRASPTSSTRRATRTWRSPRRGGRFALPSARADRRLEPRYVAAADVPVELRGAGQASRQVNNFCSPEAFEADRLIAVEVLTPGGNWSSYPPHKHDEDIPGVETVLEEIYYFEVARRRLRLPARVQLRAGPRDRHHRRGPHRRRDRDAARLPRPVDGRARLRPLLPQRDGRPGRARVALHRRPRPRLDPRDVGRARARSASAADSPRRHA